MRVDPPLVQGLESWGFSARTLSAPDQIRYGRSLGAEPTHVSIMSFMISDASLAVTISVVASTSERTMRRSSCSSAAGMAMASLQRVQLLQEPERSAVLARALSSEELPSASMGH